MKSESYEWQIKTILIAGMALLGFMWWSLANEVKSGKPFELDKKWYQAVELEQRAKE